MMAIKLDSFELISNHVKMTVSIGVETLVFLRKLFSTSIYFATVNFKVVCIANDLVVVVVVLVFNLDCILLWICRSPCFS